MVKLIALLLLLSPTAECREPIFHFMDCVLVMQGFYRGCHGQVREVSYGGTIASPVDTYEVSLTCNDGEGTVQTLTDQDLKKLPKRKCDAN